MKIRIINFNQDLSLVDFQVDYPDGKWERFREVKLIKRPNGKKWVNIWHIKRDDKYLPRYERNPSLSAIMTEVLHILEKEYNV